MHTYIHTHTHTRTQTHTHIHVYTYIYLHLQLHTHTPYLSSAHTHNIRSRFLWQIIFNVSDMNFGPLKGGSARHSMTWPLHPSDPVQLHFFEGARAKPHLRLNIQQELLAAAAEATLPSNTGQSPLELCTDGRLQVSPHMNVWGVPVLWVGIWFETVLCVICLGACSDVEVA